MNFIACIEKATGHTAKKNFMPAQPGEVPITYADVEDLKADFGFAPTTGIEEGIRAFVDWYRAYTKGR